MTEKTVEQEIQDKGLTAPRVTLADIEASIDTVYYFTGEEAVYGVNAMQVDSETRVSDVAFECVPSMRLLTICVLVMKNGFTVTGESACASPENFDAELGQRIARENAIEKVWPLIGYALRQKLHEQG